MGTRLTSLSDPRSTIYTPLTGTRLNAQTDPRSTLFTASGLDHTDAVKEKIKNVGVETAPTTVSVGTSQVETNPLDDYRSVTYNFILAALSPDMMKDPNQEWRKQPLKYVIASTRGKGVDAIDSSGTNKEVDVKKLVTVFNNESPGAFDLWIDNVEVNTIMAPTEQSGPALGTKVSFEVYEPFSINGLIEALHVSAQAAGWSNYLNATFLLKIEFIGYPDSESISTVKAKIINEKFIPIIIVGTDIDVTEQGTRYKVKAIPVNEVAHSNFNRLTAARQMRGSTVGEVINNLVVGLNDGIKNRAKNEKEDSKIHDVYEIVFPKCPEPGQEIDLKSKNKISEAPINDQLKESNVYQFKDLKDKEANPSGSNPNEKYNPKDSIVQFPVNADIIDIITAVIRDSQYLAEILKNVKDKAATGDGMFNYFQVIVNTIPLGFDSTNNVHCYTYQYVVMPYRVHASKLLGQQYNKFEPKQFDKLVKRKYDYLYGGKNVDVLNFKLNFNNLFFQASNANQGNKPSSEHATAAAPSGDDKTKLPKDQAEGTNNTSMNTAGTRVDNSASGETDRAGITRKDPYWQLSYNAHQSILESVNLLTGQLDIMGDPYYLCTSGMGNYIPKTKDIATTIDNEANVTQTPCVIKLNFRNPIDIDSKTGFLKFQSELVPFSGLYQVVNCVSKFNDGQFKQTLKVIRYPGQLAEKDSTPAKLAPPLKQEKNPLNTVVEDSAPADVQSAGVRVPTFDLAKMQSKGLPSLGFPGELNQLMAGGLKVPGLDKFLSGTKDLLQGFPGNAAGVFGGGGLPSLSGLAGQASSLLGNPLSAVGNLANGAISGVGNLISNPASLLSQAPGISQGLNALNQAGSGLGLKVGASLSGLNPLASGIRLDASAVGNVVNQIKDSGASIADASANMIANVTSIDGAKLGLDQIGSSLSDAASKGLSPALALSGASSLGLKLPNVSGLNPAALAGKLGIDTSQLSGLGGNLTADLTKQLKSISEEIPENVNLGDAKKLGFSLGSLSKSTLQNIPAFPPLDIKAPDIEKSVVDQFIDSPGDATLLAKFGLTPAMGSFNPAGALSNLGSLKSSLGGALPSAGSLVASAQAGFGSSITSQLGSLTGGSPFDKLNIPSAGNLTAQVSNLIPKIG
jgi:hypothetical protein